MLHLTVLKNITLIKLSLIIFFLCIFLISSCIKKNNGPIKIGIINIVPALDYATKGFRTGLTDMGYEENKDVVYIYERAAKSIDDVYGLVRKTLDQKPDMLVAFGNQACIASTQLTKGQEIPVVLALSARPVEFGMVKSLKQPGTNATGVHMSGWIVKTFDWLLRIKPQCKILSVPFNPKDVSAVKMLEVLKKAATKKEITLLVDSASDYESMKIIATNLPEHIDAVFMLPFELILRVTHDLVSNTQEKQIPIASCTYGSVNNGTVLSFGFEMDRCGKQAAKIANKILKGSSPKDIPLENAEFYLGLNLKSAQNINLVIPEIALKRADLIIRD